ncbi:MAG: dihydroneopterin aldolase [Acidobacteria bacterium]|nr:dihydroneopterin aldolase [Acidobacteriota bacterium]
MDKILVRGLKCELNIGVEALERRYSQICLLDMELILDLGPAAGSDSVRDTVDYARLCEQVLDLARARPYHLLEAFAGAVAERMLQHGPVREVRVSAEKVPLPLQGKLRSVGVEIHRKK